MTMWEQLVTSALMGSERRPLEIAADAPELVQTLTSVNAHHRLLLSAAVMAVYRRAGYRPAAFTIPAEPSASADIRPTCTVRAGHRLNQLLARMPAYSPLLIEWLTIIDAKGQRVHHPYLPALLDKVRLNRRNKLLSARTLAVIGERGRWLAAQNPQWAFVLKAEVAPAEKVTYTPEQLEGMDPSLVDLLSNQAEWSGPQVRHFIGWAITNENRLGFLGNLVDIVARFARESLASSLNNLQAAGSKNRYGVPALIEIVEFRINMLEDLSYG